MEVGHAIQYKSAVYNISTTTLQTKGQKSLQGRRCGAVLNKAKTMESADESVANLGSSKEVGS
jgi:hypothetical protein